MADTTQPDEISRSKIWMNDGNVVLQASRTQFRVHRSMLALHSSVFSGMFSIPQPPADDQEMIDGCPIVQLSDAVEDVEHLLSRLYFPNFASRAPVPLAAVAGLLRLGKKYEFSTFRSDAFACLAGELPTTWVEWDKYQPCKYVEHYPGVVFDMVNLLRSEGLNTLLPFAFCRCAEESLATIVRGYIREDGTSSRLSLEDQLLCGVAREKMMAERGLIAFPWMQDEGVIPVDTCSDKSQCEAERLYAVARALEPLLENYFLAGWDDYWAAGLCLECRNEVQSQYAHSHIVFWQKLPSYFNLPPWEISETRMFHSHRIDSGGIQVWHFLSRWILP